MALALVAATVLYPLAANAQMQPNAHRVGVLSTSNPNAIGPLIEAFTRRLAQLGDTEGENVLIYRLYADGNLDRLPALAQELVGRNVEVIFAPNTVAVEAAKQATRKIPIVFATVDNPVRSGFVASLAKPGGSITGVSAVQEELAAKRVQILREAFPAVRRLAVLVSHQESVSAIQVTEIASAAKALDIEVLPVDVRRREDIAPALGRLREWRADSLYAVSSAENFFNRVLLAEFAEQTRLPAMFTAEPYALAGGLMSYSPLSQALFEDAADYVHKILGGAKPADLPVQQPTRFRLVINLKTAKALGLAIPQSLLLRADEVIE